MTDVFICDAIRTPVGRYGGSLSSIRPDDLGAIPLREIMKRNPDVDWLAVDDILMGCANQEEKIIVMLPEWLPYLLDFQKLFQDQQ